MHFSEHHVKQLSHGQILRKRDNTEEDNNNEHLIVGDVGDELTNMLETTTSSCANVLTLTI